MLAAHPPVKITFVGDACVGKTSIVNRVAKNEFSDHTMSTIGAAFCTLKYALHGRERTYHIWDTAGQERYYSLIPLYLSGAQIIVIVYDITNRESFEKIASNWLPYIRRNLRLRDDEPMPMLYLLGNKLDLMEKHRRVPAAEAESFAREHNMGFLEISAKTGEGAKEVFRHIALHADNLLIQQADALQNERANTIDLSAQTTNDRSSDGSCWGSVVARLWWQ